MSDLRADILAIPTPKRFENDANGNWFTTDMEYGWDCGIEAAAALIPEGAVLVTEKTLAAALIQTGMYLDAIEPGLDTPQRYAAAIIAELREGTE